MFLFLQEFVELVQVPPLQGSGSAQKKYMMGFRRVFFQLVSGLVFVVEGVQVIVGTWNWIKE